MTEWEPTVEQVSLGANAILQIANMELENQERPNWLIARAVLEAAGQNIEEEALSKLGPSKFIAFPCGEHVGTLYGHLTCPVKEHSNGSGNSGEIPSAYQGNGRGTLSSTEEIEEEALPGDNDGSWY